MHYLFFNMGQVKLSMDKYVMAIYFSLGKYKHLLFPHLCVRLNMGTTHALVSAHQECFQSYINTAFRIQIFRGNYLNLRLKAPVQVENIQVFTQLNKMSRLKNLSMVINYVKFSFHFNAYCFKSKPVLRRSI